MIVNRNSPKSPIYQPNELDNKLPSPLCYGFNSLEFRKPPALDALASREWELVCEQQRTLCCKASAIDDFISGFFQNTGVKMHYARRWKLRRESRNLDFLSDQLLASNKKLNELAIQKSEKDSPATLRTKSPRLRPDLFFPLNRLKRDLKTIAVSLEALQHHLHLHFREEITEYLTPYTEKQRFRNAYRQSETLDKEIERYTFMFASWIGIKTKEAVIHPLFGGAENFLYFLDDLSHTRKCLINGINDCCGLIAYSKKNGQTPTPEMHRAAAAGLTVCIELQSKCLLKLDEIEAAFNLHCELGTDPALTPHTFSYDYLHGEKNRMQLFEYLHAAVNNILDEIIELNGCRLEVSLASLESHPHFAHRLEEKLKPHLCALEKTNASIELTQQRLKNHQGRNEADLLDLLKEHLTFKAFSCEHQFRTLAKLAKWIAKLDASTNHPE